MAAKTSEWIRYRDGLWIPHRRRTYFYWFKFLQEAELSESHTVDWSRYADWGGKDAIVGQKFDPWWEKHWKKLFAVKSRGAPKSEIRFPLTTSQLKTDALRMSLLIWQNRNAGLEILPGSARPKKAGNTAAIAEAVIRIEKRKRSPVASINQNRGGRDGVLKSEVQSRVGRYLSNAGKILSNVCEGKFP
jgi:hypothetical protein